MVSCKLLFFFMQNACCLLKEVLSKELPPLIVLNIAAVTKILNHYKKWHWCSSD
jgi:hypothetical protein